MVAVTRHRSMPLADDPEKDALLQLARRQRVAVRFDRAAQVVGFPHVRLATKPGGLLLGVFKNCAQAARFLRGNA